MIDTRHGNHACDALISDIAESILCGKLFIIKLICSPLCLDKIEN